MFEIFYNEKWWRVGGGGCPLPLIPQLEVSCRVSDFCLLKNRSDNPALIRAKKRPPLSHRTWGLYFVHWFSLRHWCNCLAFEHVSSHFLLWCIACFLDEVQRRVPAPKVTHYLNRSSLGIIVTTFRFPAFSMTAHFPPWGSFFKSDEHRGWPCSRQLCTFSECAP